VNALVWLILAVIVIALLTPAGVGMQHCRRTGGVAVHQPSVPGRFARHDGRT